jgi:spore germination protein YaaH/peptidoglycan/xylan/chitin deacetylase (PgdA/CDA1 family)
MTSPVFHDPSGRRARRAGAVLAIVLSVFVAVVAAFFMTLATAPRMPTVRLQDPRVLSALHVENVKRLKKEPGWTQVPRPHHAPHGIAAGPLSIGFYVSWDELSRHSLRDHVQQLDVVAPQWIDLEDANGAITVTDDPQATAIITAAPRPPSILPVIYNAKNMTFDGAMADAFLQNPAARKAMIDRLVALARAKGYGGYVFDLEDMSPAGLKAYPSFIAQANAALNPLGREVWVTAPMDDEAWPLVALQKASDTLMLMAYDEHWLTGDPGPAAGQDWYQSHLSEAFKVLDPKKVIMVLGAYGYDWTLHSKTGKARADVLTFHEATVLAKDSGAAVRMDRASLNPGFGYADEDGETHSVWFLDASTFYNQMKVADPWRPRGYGVWRLGSEDPGIWSLLGKTYGGANPASLATMGPGEGVDFDGTGEVLHVSATPTPGKRSLTIDPAHGLITDQTYDVLPTSYEIQRYGAHPGLVALTFDDGPDPRWTPQILKILKEKNAKATFFVIGENMQTWPGLVQKELAQGHMIGNHTYSHPNIGETSDTQTTIELSATQRLFETITGKSLRLFRPPYFGDAEPSTPKEVAPILAAQKQGYLIAGLRIDPDDWQRPDAKLIVERALNRLADKNPETGGQVILLHDSGGNRERTVEALPHLIDALRANGYRLVTVAELAGLRPDQALPPTSRDSFSLLLDRLGFGAFRIINAFLRILFITAIALGLARLVFLTTLSIVHRLTAPGRTPPEFDPATGPLVSVLIPCFNEEKVIAASVRQILASNWPNLEIIVLDDGSTDGTSAAVEAAFASHPKVRLVRFENGGKARALNRGLDLAKGEIIVALDADTLFGPDTLGRLARWFSDPVIGAVAGNALVGNRLNLITRWQALEYVTAQNLERRALAALGAVTVVPGAVGAWRKSALLDLGGYPTDTLAEDQDLTIAVQRAGWEVAFDPDARAYTEAPDTVSGLLKQRFRWSFGTLQCLWKHRSALFNPKQPVLGFIALAQIWMFQIVLAMAAPLVDLAVVWGIVSGILGHMAHPLEWSGDETRDILLYWGVFVLIDLMAGVLGMAMEKEAPWSDLPWLPLQRFGYRQLMYSVVVRAVITAVRGPRVGWGKLERRATAALGTGSNS